MEELKKNISQPDLIEVIEHSTQQHQNTYSLHVHMEYLPRETIF